MVAGVCSGTPLHGIPGLQVRSVLLSFQPPPRNYINSNNSGIWGLGINSFIINSGVGGLLQISLISLIYLGVDIFNTCAFHAISLLRYYLIFLRGSIKLSLYLSFLVALLSLCLPLLSFCVLLLGFIYLFFPLFFDCVCYCISI